MANEDLMTCPKCNSTLLSADERGVSVGGAVAGAVLAGGVGALAGGLIGSGATRIDCWDCGYRFKPSNYEEEKKKFAPPTKSDEVAGAIFLCILSVAGIFFSVRLFMNGWIIFGVLLSIATIICILITVAGLTPLPKQR